MREEVLLLVSGADAALQVDPEDDVATALRDLEPGEMVFGTIVRDAIPIGHKIAVRAIAEGADVRKYGWPIGRATRAIAAGDHVHVHNVATGLGHDSACLYDQVDRRPTMANSDSRTFRGYLRRDGRVGTRNEIWVLCTVGCVANTARRIAGIAATRFAGRIDGIHAFPHPYGCSQLGDDLDQTRRILASLASHPNAGGVLVVGLGCENNQLAGLLDDVTIERERLRWFAAQSVGDEIEEGVGAVEALVRVAERDERSNRSLGDLVLGLKCGGSDGFSGLTANPLVGRIADVVAAADGVAILTEIPEIFGAEQMLENRSDAAIAREIAKLVDGFKRYFLDHGEPIHENPSPGNIAGGITTLEEKSLGAVQKAGRSPVTAVLLYGERASTRGLNLLEAPGNDAISSTALVAAGATLLLFTTGRGTPMGFPAPTLKISSNSALAGRKPGWIDFDAGVLLTGAEGEEVTGALLDLVTAAASGAPTRAERNDEREIAIWKRGVTL